MANRRGRDAVDCHPVKHKTGRFENKTLLEVAKDLDEVRCGFKTDQALAKIPKVQRQPGDTIFQTIEREAPAPRPDAVGPARRLHQHHPRGLEAARGRPRPRRGAGRGDGRQDQVRPEILALRRPWPARQGGRQGQPAPGGDRARRQREAQPPAPDHPRGRLDEERAQERLRWERCGGPPSARRSRSRSRRGATRRANSGSRAASWRS